MEANPWWVDPREDPSPPYCGPERPLAADEAGLAELIIACKQGRLYNVERCRGVLEILANTKGVPGSIKRGARERLSPPGR